MTKKALPPSPKLTNLDAVLKAGKVLMESGAEIYRVEDTMRRMSQALGIQNFEAYVVNRGIMASGMNRKGLQESKVINVNEVEINMNKLEAINTLSRSLAHRRHLTSAYVFKNLNEIECRQDYTPFQVLNAYFWGAGGFSLALGSSWSDSLASALSGLVAGLVFQLIGSKIHTGFLLTIMGSAAIALTANVLYALGLGQHRGLIILGALMVLVPGAFFVNSVREFSQNNFSTGLSLLMSALLTCFSISVGIAATIALLPFAEQMTTPFSNVTHTWWEGLVKVVMAGVGTIAFSLLYHVPKRYFGDLGILGALSWFLYLFIYQTTEIEAVAVLFPALFVAFFSRVLAAKRKSPMTIFLSTSIFPLIPGLGFYRAIYFLITGMDNLALTYMRSCFITAFTIAIAISIVQQIPLDYFTKRRMK